MRFILALVLTAATFGCSDVEDKSNSATPIDCSGGQSCPDGTTCSRGSGSEFRCLLECGGPTDCGDEQDCVSDEEGFRVCDNPRPVCAADAPEADCECGFKAGGAFRVSGTGEECTVVERDVDACYSQWSTCLNACVDEFFRYDLGDGTALIVRGLQGGITEGWVNDGQSSSFPMSCPALEGEFAPSRF